MNIILVFAIFISALASAQRLLDPTQFDQGTLSFLLV